MNELEGMKFVDREMDLGNDEIEGRTMVVDGHLIQPEEEEEEQPLMTQPPEAGDTNERAIDNTEVGETSSHSPRSWRVYHWEEQ